MSSTPLTEERLPTTVARRAEILGRLRQGPAGADDLQRDTGASESTVRRAISDLASEAIVRKSDGEVELTGLGDVLADELVAFRTRIDAAYHLAPLLDAIGTEVEIPVEHFADADVVRSGSGVAHAIERRIIEGIADADSLRLFSGVVSPFYLEALYREVHEGMTAEAIFDRRAVEILFAGYAGESREATRTGNLSVRIHDECPFELFVFDDSVGVAAHDGDGAGRVYVESDDPDAVAWGEDLFEECRRESEYVTLF